MNQKRLPVFWKKHTDKIGVAGLILAALVANATTRMN